MNTVGEIEDALKGLPLHDAQNIARWLLRHIDQKGGSKTVSSDPAKVELPDYAARRRMILGDKILPNMVVPGREEYRW